MRRTFLLICFAVSAAASSSCTAIARMEARSLVRDSVSIAIQIPPDHTPDSAAHLLPETLDADTLTIVNEDGKRVHFMKATMDSTGTLHASVPLNPVVVTARFKNIPERNGRIRLAFDINVPEKMLNRQWQIRIVPHAVLKNDTLELEPLYITGSEYRKRQLRGYELYRRFLASIITDSTLLFHSGPLEAFIERNFPEAAALRTDSSFVDSSRITGLYGISFTEARQHFSKKALISRNNRKKNNLQHKFFQLVKAPVADEGIRLDTLSVQDDGDFTFSYVEDFKTRADLKKIDILIDGGIYCQGELLHKFPLSDAVTFYVSSFSTFAEDIDRYVTKIIERRMEFNTTASINFRPGAYTIDGSYMSNQAELEYIRSIISDILTSKEFIADSIIITASCSPEGSPDMNSYLAKRRAHSISGYLDSLGVRTSEKHIPGNWDKLKLLVISDSAVKDKTGIMTMLNDAPSGQKEHLLSSHPEYPYIRSSLYPLLREVDFKFHLHRKDMVKDTVHTTELDTVYRKGVQALKNRNYAEALKILGGYRDINSAVAFLAMDYNASAMNILEDLPVSAGRDYLLAVCHSRIGNEKLAVECYINAVKQDKSLFFRGNLDPEISRLIKKYSIVIQN
ncbi:MAG TPA: hypothetical protein IAC04_05185 [Candidatus Coprenecus stercoravium]|uniref:OmpA-like domain-containing protein n=1 Tax=Candidatus Coprenecus stercoravium TaxID=2840735 RepID=A0A9D2K8W1_9BACT|nr:hypothetical protein [Candidatus Coprenecus stercoravium]